MSTAEKIERIGKASPRLRATFVGVYYLLTLMACAFVFFFRGGQPFTVHLVTGVFFITMTACFYGLTVSANKRKGR